MPWDLVVSVTAWTVCSSFSKGQSYSTLSSHSPSSQPFFYHISNSPIILLHSKIFERDVASTKIAGFDSGGSKFNHHPRVELPFIRSDVCQKVW